MPKKNQAEKIYDEAKALYKQGKYDDAKAKYEEIKTCKSLRFLGQLAIAQMFFEQKIKPSADREYVSQEYVEAAMDVLLSAVTQTSEIKEGHRGDTNIVNIRKKLDQVKENSGDGRKLLAEKYYFLARLEKLCVKPLQSDRYLAAAISHGYEAALIEAEELLQNLNEKRLKIFLAKSIEFLAAGDVSLLVSSQLEFVCLTLLAVIHSEKEKQTIADVSLKIGLFSQSNDNSDQEKKIIEDYNFDNLKRDLCLVANQLVSKVPPLDFKRWVRAVNILLDKQQFSYQLLVIVRDYINALPDEDLEKFQEEIACLRCRLGEFLSEQEMVGVATQDAIALIEIGFNKLAKGASNYNNFLKILKNLYRRYNMSAKLEDLENILYVNPESSYQRANQCYLAWSENKQNVTEFRDAVTHYKIAAIAQHAGAITKIKELFEQKLMEPEVVGAYVELLEKLPKQIIDQHRLLSQKNKKKKIENYVSELKEKAKNKYEETLKAQYGNSGFHRPDIFRVVSQMRYQGDLFEKNLPLARQLAEEAYKRDDEKILLHLAKMCFYGEGGPVDLTKAREIVSLVDYPEDDAEALYLKGEIFYTDYLCAVDAKLDREAALNKAIEYFEKAARKGHKESLLSLFISHHWDKERAATKCLAELYQHQLDSNPLLQQIKFPQIPHEVKNYHLFFYQCLFEQNAAVIEQVPELNNFLRQEDEARRQRDLRAKELAAVCGNDVVDQATLQAALDELAGFAKQGCSAAKFFIAKYQLIKLNNPLPLRKIDDPDFFTEIVELLTAHYYRKEHAIKQLITSLCYENKRHAFDSMPCKIIIQVLVSLDERYKNYAMKDFVEEMEEFEQKDGNYYDEYPSDDSDMETENTYQGLNKHVTTDYVRAKKFVDSIQPIALKKLKALFKLKNVDDAKYDVEVKDIKSLFHETVKTLMRSQKKYDANLENELQTVNHFSAQGKLGEALSQISLPIVCAQSRGFHFLTTKWNQPQRHKYWQEIKDKTHPLLQRPIYSSAVYERAGIKDFTDDTELAQLRLQKIAKYLQIQMSRLKTSKPYAKEDGVELPNSYYSHTYTSLNEQLQQLYSNNYDQVHKFLAKAMQQPDPIFVSPANPFVSTADLNSTHSHTYAGGNKEYQGDIHERSRPKYNRDGRSIRPHSGFVMYTLNPLSDYAFHGCNHVPSMNFNHQLWIDWTVGPELESSFYAYIERNRLFYIHPTKYPSFHHKMCPKTFYTSYGIDQELYDNFKKLIIASKPHEPKRRLAILLLGQYLASYQTLFFMRHVQEKAEKQGYKLVFRDKHGNFSQWPCFDFSPLPNGGEDRHRLVRHYSFIANMGKEAEKSAESQKENQKKRPAADDVPDTLGDAKRRKPNEGQQVGSHESDGDNNDVEMEMDENDLQDANADNESGYDSDGGMSYR